MVQEKSFISKFIHSTDWLQRNTFYQVKILYGRVSHNNWENPEIKMIVLIIYFKFKLYTFLILIEYKYNKYCKIELPLDVLHMRTTLLKCTSLMTPIDCVWRNKSSGFILHHLKTCLLINRFSRGWFFVKSKNYWSSSRKLFIAIKIFQIIWSHTV